MTAFPTFVYRPRSHWNADGTTKLRFNTKAEARAHIKRERLEHVAYACTAESCGAWHTAKKKDAPT